MLHPGLVAARGRDRLERRDRRDGRYVARAPAPGGGGRAAGSEVTATLVYAGVVPVHLRFTVSTILERVAERIA